jgi:hypothetical protein
MHRQHGMKWLLDEDGMSKEYLQLFIWNNHDLDDLRNHLIQHVPAIVEWFSPYECDIKTFPEYDILKEYKISNPQSVIRILSGENTTDYVNEDLIEIYHYPVIFFINTINTYKDMISDVKQHPLTHKICSFNNFGHYYRCMLIDRLYRDNIINESNLISWQNKKVDQTYTFNWFETKQILVDDFQESQFNVNRHPNYDSTFLHVVTETSNEHFFITEKTVKPLILGRPFIVYSKPGFNHMLQDMGFELYDEIIDYTFDLIQDREEYCEGLVDQIKKIDKLSFTELENINKTLIPKIQRNQQRALDIRYDGRFQDIVMSEWKKYQSNDTSINIINGNNRSMNWYWIIENFFNRNDYEKNKSIL